MLLTGYYNGTEITDTILLIGGIVVEIPIAMVLFSLLLTRKIGRPITFIAALITTAALLFTLPSDPDDLFFLIIELVAIFGILSTAWTWSEPAPAHG